MFKYDKISIVVVTENLEEMFKYYRLFKFLISDKPYESLETNHQCTLENEKVNIRFILKHDNQRGIRAHYVLNLTQDKEYNDLCAIPMARIHSYLKDDPKWMMLFE
jgi:hypothetical protein